MRLPFYERPQNANFQFGDGQVHFIEIVEFLKYAVNRDKLEITGYLGQMGQNPFFLIAATGLGKTVAVPVHVLLRQMQRMGEAAERDPRIWVVEPRIPIATDQAAFMNNLWQQFGRRKKKNHPPLFGCVTSTTGHQNPGALVKFITTGVFAQLAKSGELSATRDRVIIDEAHVTIEQNPDVELAITLARKAGVTVDYMSATVNPTGLKESLGVSEIIRADKTRQTVWKCNLNQPLESVLEELVANTLVSPDPTSRFYPQPNEFPQAQEVLNAILEPGRSHGMLVVVNSFAGDQSDISQLRELLNRKFPELPVLSMASAILRNAKDEQAFKGELSRIEAAKQNYVILATSVVEMGITFPTLDYIVTMDSGYIQQTIGGDTYPVVGPLGVNALLQRLGRVGRKRPGIGYISCEVGAPYTELDNQQLNSKPLPREPIRFPLETASLLPLAHYMWGEGYRDFKLALRWFNFPSRLDQKRGRIEELYAQLHYLESLGLTCPDGLMHLGEKIEPWIGRADLAYAAQLQRCVAENASEAELVFWLVATALCDMPITPLHGQYGYFADFDGTKNSIGKSAKLLPFRDAPHEDLQLFRLIATLSEYFPGEMWDNAPLGYAVGRAMERLGIDPDELRKMTVAIAGFTKLFTRVNKRRPINLASLNWTEIDGSAPYLQLASALAGMPQAVPVTFQPHPEEGFAWQTENGEKGFILQDDTFIQLNLPEAKYFGRPMPAKSEGGTTHWQLMHIGISQP